MLVYLTYYLVVYLYNVSRWKGMERERERRKEEERLYIYETEEGLKGKRDEQRVEIKIMSMNGC